MSLAGRSLVQAVLLFAALTFTQAASAQTLDFGGRAFVDYFYTLSSSNPTAEGLHGFTYRRLYLTADYTLSDNFFGRARLEANEGTTGPKGPVPYVKDLYLTWNYSGDHSATLGVTPPPAFGISDDLWGYRSLAKTIMDLEEIVDSRDFGLRFDGPLGGGETLRYAVMIANNSAARPETNAYKRAYGQLSGTPTENVTLVAGADVAGYEDQRERSTRLSAFGSYHPGPFRVGVEGYWYKLTFENAGDLTDTGISVFGIVEVAPGWELVARLDRSRERVPGADHVDSFFLTAVAYQPHPNVKLMPNLRLRSADGAEDPETRARFTVEVSF